MFPRRRPPLSWHCIRSLFFVPRLLLPSLVSPLQPSSIAQRHLSAAVNMSRTELLYQPYRKHAVLFEGVFLEEWLHPSMAKLVNAFELMPLPTNTGNNDNIDLLSQLDPALIKVESTDVYSFDCFSDQFLQMFNEELDNFYAASETYKIPIRRPNSSKHMIDNVLGSHACCDSFDAHNFPHTI